VPRPTVAHPLDSFIVSPLSTSGRSHPFVSPPTHPLPIPPITHYTTSTPRSHHTTSTPHFTSLSNPKNPCTRPNQLYTH
jgi:hypothetical protein